LANEKKRKSIYRDADGAGKGDRPRTKISPKEWGERWDKIFGQKSDKKRKSVQVDK
tara:strand:+ start:1237 stop:1404 length:168 start_codon:yes stop_codon:yes gene_type:complete